MFDTEIIVASSLVLVYKKQDIKSPIRLVSA